MSRAARAVSHEGLSPLAGARPGAARLTDQQRLAVVLQGVALLGHLDQAGLALADGWKGARIGAGGQLGALTAGAGRDPASPQRRAEELLLALFRAETAIAGRGAARRAARELLDLWRQDVQPIAADRLVAQVLGAAPFLWQEGFGEARAALAAEIGSRERELWVVGPRRFRRRLLALGSDSEALRSLLAGPRAERLWMAAGSDGDPVELAAAGRWRQALAVWADSPPNDPDGRFEQARVLYSVGRFVAAKQALHGLRRDPARVLRLACQLRLGELAAVRRGLAAWEGRRTSDEVRVDLAAIAVRLFASVGQPQAAGPWLERAAGCSDPVWRLRAELVAGEAAWDRGDQERVAAAVTATASGAEIPAVGWRREHLRALAALATGDGAGVVSHIERAFARRRVLRPIEAASLWNDLALGRSLIGDLAGAERALRHVARLTDGSEGDRRLALALCNLAEVRLRRGKVQGVRDVLERAARVNSQAGNWRGWAQDRELEARYELVRGRLGAVVACVDETLERLAERDLEWRRGPLRVMAARAYGWLGDAAAAARFLESTTAADRAELEIEERAPLWALAGDREAALEENPEGPCRRLWQQLLTGEEVDWTPLHDLEPYRAARLVLDAELVAPGRAPGPWVRRAAATLRAVGALTLAERLAADGEVAWRALEDYLGGGGAVADRLERLLAAVSPEARLTWRDRDSEIELVAGVGGAEALEQPAHGGALRLAAPQIGPAERVAVALACRDLPASAVGARRRARRRRHGMIGESPAMIAALDRLSRFAARDLPVLIHGETGTGKEIAARLVHADSRRAGGPFLPVNCAELGESLLLSELFGHVKGAFTGAERDRTGIFEAARGGTVLLDEIGDMPLLAQSKLLRVLQEGEIRRVGESVARPVDVRIVAATHRDLAAMVSEGSFRQDLLYRLKVGHVSLPPLRDRGPDLLLLVEHFLAEHGAGVAPRLSKAARAKLLAHSWPGNVRELSNVLTVAVALADGGRLEAEHLDLPEASGEPRGSYHERVEGFRRGLVREAVAASGGNRAAAARRLGLSRQALSYLTRQLDIE